MRIQPYSVSVLDLQKNRTCYKISIGDLITRKRFCKRYANLLEPDIILFISASAFQRTQDIGNPIIRAQGISISGPPKPLSVIESLTVPSLNTISPNRKRMLQISRERINAGPRVKKGIPVDVTVITGTVNNRPRCGRHVS